MINFLARETFLQDSEERPLSKNILDGKLIFFVPVMPFYSFHQVILVHKECRDHRETKVCTLDIYCNVGESIMELNYC